MELIPALALLAVLLPALGAILVFFAPDAVRRALVLLFSGLLVLVGGVLGLAFLLDGAGEVAILAEELPLGSAIWAIDIAVLDIALMVFFIYLGWRARSPRSAVFALAQLVTIGGFEAWHGTVEASAAPVLLDRLSLMLVLVTSIVGSFICVFALHYMRGRANRGRFFAFMLLFLAAMNGAVISNDLLWLFFFWEITTLCSYYLIYHDETEEAKASARLALEVTLGGGVALAFAIVYAGVELEAYELAELMGLRDVPGIILLVPALVVLAGMTKSAQVPFQGWLLGAMVAPTPVSALLHSSTMVNLGVYVILRAAPLIKLFGPLTYLVAGLGAVTFAATSLLAATQRNAKRLLAYSTVSNLGLVVMCAGINTSAALVAGVFVLLFHAVSKGMLFLAVGVVDRELHTKDIDEMGSLVERMPQVTWVILLGAVSMVLPPFGLFAGKWLSFEASTSLPVLILLLGVGSAATILYYTKWVGHLISRGEEPTVRAQPLSRFYSVPLGVLSVAIVALSVLTPFLAADFVFPSLPFGYTDPASEGSAGLLGSSGYLWIAAIFVALAAGLAIPMYIVRVHHEDRSTVYSCGEPYEPVVSSSFFGGERLAQPLSELAITLSSALLVAVMLIPFLEEVL